MEYEYTVLGREEDSGKYIVRKIKASSEKEAEEKFLYNYRDGFAYVQRIGLTNTDITKVPEEYDVVEIVWPKFYENENGGLEAKTEFITAMGVVKTIYDGEQNKHMTHPFFVEFCADKDHLNEGLGELWQLQHLQVLLSF